MSACFPLVERWGWGIKKRSIYRRRMEQSIRKVYDVGNGSFLWSLETISI